MAQYNISVKDGGTGSPIVAADIVFLDNNGNTITDNGSPTGQPVYLQTDAQGNATFTNGSPQVNVKVGALGYNDYTATLNPGQSNIQLSKEYEGPTATITAARSFYDKYKTAIWIALAIGLLLLAKKYGIIKL